MLSQAKMLSSNLKGSTAVYISPDNPYWKFLILVAIPIMSRQAFILWHWVNYHLSLVQLLEVKLMLIL